MVSRKIAVLCNYQLLPERVGGMDYFFWQFDAKCKQNNIEVDWFFPNCPDHGKYSKLTIFYSNTATIESFFLKYCSQNNKEYESVITHFIELCTPFFKKVKQFYNTKIIAVDHNPRPLNGYSFDKKISTLRFNSFTKLLPIKTTNDAANQSAFSSGAFYFTYCTPHGTILICLNFLLPGLY